MNYWDKFKKQISKDEVTEKVLKENEVIVTLIESALKECGKNQLFDSENLKKYVTEIELSLQTFDNNTISLNDSGKTNFKLNVELVIKDLERKLKLNQIREIGSKINDIRVSKKISLAQLSKETDITHSFLAKMSNGKSGHLSLSMFIELTSYLELSDNDILELLKIEK